MKRRRWVLVCALIVVGAVIVSLVNYRSEPRYKGKSLSAWVRIWSESNNEDEKYEAAEAVDRIGMNAIPFLLEDVRAGDADWIRKVSVRLSDWPGPVAKWWDSLLVTADRRNQRGLVGLVMLGSNAAAAIPELLGQTQRGDRPAIAAAAMSVIGKPAIGPLTHAITNRANSTGLRICAIEALQGMRTNAAEALCVVVSCVNDEDDVSESAIGALPLVAMEPETIIPALTNALRSPRPRVRAAAVRELGSLASQDLILVQVLWGSLCDQNESVRQSATNALRRFKPSYFPPLSR